jgi:hypothetical protein
LLALVQLPRMTALTRPFPPHFTTGGAPFHVRPIPADERKENTMTIIILILPMNALKQFIAALARCIKAFRRR